MKQEEEIYLLISAYTCVILLVGVLVGFCIGVKYQQNKQLPYGRPYHMEQQNDDRYQSH